MKKRKPIRAWAVICADGHLRIDPFRRLSGARTELKLPWSEDCEPHTHTIVELVERRKTKTRKKRQ